MVLGSLGGDLWSIMLCYTGGMAVLFILIGISAVSI
jgi:hypothetical protein